MATMLPLATGSDVSPHVGCLCGHQGPTGSPVSDTAYDSTIRAVSLPVVKPLHPVDQSHEPLEGSSSSF